MDSKIKIAAVVVTYNRLDKLRNTLDAYSKISSGLDYLVVVDNNSSDGTSEFLSSWQLSDDCKYKKIVKSLSDNLGGAGGFYYGCKEAITLGVEWVVVADDDAYPDMNMVNEFKNFLDNNDTNEIVAICSTVYRVDDSIDTEHRKWLKYKMGIRPTFIPSKETDYSKNFFEIDLFSYVGTFMKVDALMKVGLCIPELFIYYDDVEHGMRLGTVGKIVCVPSIKYCHDDGFGIAKSQSNILMSWRNYYDIRNKIYIFLKHRKTAGIFWAISRILMSLVEYPTSLKCQKLYMIAIMDGIRGKLGKHPLYRPPFSIKSNKHEY